jgi:3,4-dihydroxyphenylacetaldehyde synthase
LNKLTQKFEYFKDAAYAGAAFALPEYAHIKKGAEYGDSINFNLHKWMLVNFDCAAMWIKDAGALTQSFNVERIYLDHKYQGESKAPDYRHWQLALGRRFRSLRVWITLRTYGQEYIRNYLREHINLASLFLNYVSTDDRFEQAGQSLALAFFRLKGEDELTRKLLDKMTERKKVFMIPAFYQNKVIIRFVICGMDTKEKDIEFAWNEVKYCADELFSEIEAEKIQKQIDSNNNELSDKVNIVSDNISMNLHICEEKTKH